MFTLVLLFALRFCSAEITTECSAITPPARPADFVQREVVLTFATREACLAEVERWRAYVAKPGHRFGEGPRPPLAGVPAAYDLAFTPAPYNCVRAPAAPIS